MCNSSHTVFDVYCLLPICKYIYFTVSRTVTSRCVMFILDIYLLPAVTKEFVCSVYKFNYECMFYPSLFPFEVYFLEGKNSKFMRPPCCLCYNCLAHLYYLSQFSMIPSLQRITWFECRLPKYLCVVHYGKQTWFPCSKSSLL